MRYPPCDFRHSTGVEIEAPVSCEKQFLQFLIAHLRQVYTEFKVAALITFEVRAATHFLCNAIQFGIGVGVHEEESGLS